MTSRWLCLKSMAHWTLDLIVSIVALVCSVNLNRKTFRISVVFDTKRHLMRVFVIEKFLIKLSVSRLVFWFERFHVGVVEHGLHRIANGVVSGNFIVVHAANQEVVCKEILAGEVALPVSDLASFSLDVFEDNSFSGGIYNSA